MRLTSAPSFMNSVEEKLREARKKTRIGGVRNVRVSAYSIFSGKHGKFSFHNKENRIWIMLCIKQTPKKNGKTEKTDNADEPSERDTYTHTGNTMFNIAQRNKLFCVCYLCWLCDSLSRWYGAHEAFAYLNKFDNFLLCQNRQQQKENINPCNGAFNDGFVCIAPERQLLTWFCILKRF